LRTALNVRLAASGSLLAQVALPAPCWSGVATAGNALVFGTGASFTGAGSGIMALTPSGVAPKMPHE
jgi:hypothetical protein